MKIIFIFIILTAHIYAQDKPVKLQVSGSAEVQTRQTENSTEAQEQLGQDWNRSDFSVFLGNLNGKLQLKDSKIEANWFFRQSQSSLYNERDMLGNNYLAPNFWNFPTRLVARDLFKMSHQKRDDKKQTDSVITKLFYEWDNADTRFVIGRMYINYGIGEVYNPINPFNQPTGLSSQGQVAQGNDGIKVSFFLSEKSTLDFFLLGDKRIDGYEGQINKTAWVHGEYRHNEKWQFEYVFGEDQKRQKVGGQASYALTQGLLFSQVLYQTELNNNKPSEHLWDIMLGYDQQVTSRWHIRSELGHQKFDDKINQNNTTNMNDRFLFSEYFVAIANEVELHALVKTTFTLVHDFKTRFGYGIAKLNFSVAQNWELEAFAFSPIYKDGEKQNLAQKILTNDVGVALRAFF